MLPRADVTTQSAKSQRFRPPLEPRATLKAACASCKTSKYFGIVIKRGKRRTQSLSQRPRVKFNHLMYQSFLDSEGLKPVRPAPFPRLRKSGCANLEKRLPSPRLAAKLFREPHADDARRRDIGKESARIDRITIPIGEDLVGKRRSSRTCLDEIIKQIIDVGCDRPI